MNKVKVKDLKELIKGLPDDAEVDIEPLVDEYQLYSDGIRESVKDELMEKYDTYKLDTDMLNEVLDKITRNIIDDGSFDPDVDTIENETSWVLNETISDTDSRTYNDAFREQEAEYDRIFGDLHDTVREVLGERYDLDELLESDTIGDNDIEEFVKLVLNHIRASGQLETVDIDGINNIVDYELENYRDEEGYTFGERFDEALEGQDIGG